jgi:multidrug efflux pump subunit AcrA (membrane-fusion protein)
MILKNIFNVLIISSAVLLTFCGDEEKTKQNTDEYSIPVKVEKVKYQPFEQFLTFYSKLMGIKEATKGAMIGGKIERVNFSVGSFVRERDIVVEFDTYNPAIQYQQAKTAYENLKKNYEK